MSPITVTRHDPPASEGVPTEIKLHWSPPLPLPSTGANARQLLDLAAVVALDQTVRNEHLVDISRRATAAYLELYSAEEGRQATADRG